MADDFLNEEDFWDGEEEEGHFERDRFPRVWLLSMGILSVILVVGVVALALLALFRPTPPPTSVPSPERETGAEDTPTPMMLQGTPVLPLFTPTPTPVPTMPAGIAIGIYVKVSGTEGTDLSFRAGPSTNHVRLKIVAEGSVLKVLDGPVEDDGYVWWQLQDVSDGTVGWAVADYLEPTVP